MKQLEVTILGQSYLLACPEGGETLLQAAVARVDEEMSAIRDAGKVRARERMAVLAALNLAYQMAQTEEVAELPGAAPERGASPDAAAERNEARGESRSTHDAAATADDEAIDRLIDRIDTALGRDGQLL